MKILFVNEKCGYFGGVEQNVADSVKSLRARGHACYLAYGELTDRNEIKYRALFDNCFHCKEVMPSTEHTSNFDNTFFSFDEVIRAISPDVIYFHKVPDIAGFQPLPENIRQVRMVHDHDLCCPRRHKYFALNGHACNHKADWRCYFDGAFVERSPASAFGIRLVSIASKLRKMRSNYSLDALLVGSEFMRRELLQNGFPCDRVHILAPVVREQNSQPTPVPKENNILFVGQLIRGKGVDLLLDALSHVSCDFKATIVGSGNAMDNLKAISRISGLERKVCFEGWIDNNRLATLYRAAKVVVVPSRWPEPFGMIGLESMQHGRAVVGFDVGGIPDWLEHNVTGLLAPEQDTKALAKSIEQVLLNNELAARLGQNAYQRVQVRFNFNRYIDQLESFLGNGSHTNSQTEY